MPLLPTRFLGRLLALITLVTLPWLGLLGHELVQRHRQAEADAQARVRERAALVSREVGEALQRARRLLDFLAARPEIRQADSAACQALLAGLAGIDPLLANAGLAGADGRLLCTSVPAGRWPPSLAADPEFQAAVRQQRPDIFVGAPRWGAVVDRPVLALARAVAGPGGRTAGLVIVTLDLQAWSATWARHASEPGASVVVTNREGAVVGRYPDPGPWTGPEARARYERFVQGRPSDTAPDTTPDTAPDTAPDAASDAGAAGVRQVSASQEVPGWGWRAGAAIPESVALAPAHAAWRRTATGLGLMTALLLMLAWWLSRRLAAPLQQLAATVRAVAEGRPDARVDERLPGEFGALAVEFNRMLASRGQAEARLAASERRFREMLDTVELFAVVVDREGRLTYCNDFFLRHTGWRLDELGGDDFVARCIPPERRGAAGPWRAAVREGRISPQRESELLTRSGERRMVRWSSTVLRDEQGRVEGRAGIGEDVTDQRRAERQARRLAGFLAALSRTQRAIIHRAERGPLLQAACDACVDAGQARIASAWWLAGDGLATVAWAGPAELLFGPMPALRDPRAAGFAATLAGQALFHGRVGVSNRLADDDRAGDWRAQAVAAGVQAQAVFPMRCDGAIVGVLLLHVDEPDWFDPALVELLGQLADDLAFALDNLARERARLQAEDRLASHERQLASIVDSAMDAIVTIDAAQRVVMFNRAAAELFQTPAGQAIGRSLDDFIPPELLARHKRGLQAFIDGDRDHVAIGRDHPLLGQRPDGSRFPFEAAVSRQGRGERMTMTAVMRDLSERVAAEAAREARVVAEAASHAKTEFLSRMSHELRTPLNAMLGFAQLLSDDPRDPLSPRQQRHVALTREAGWHLLALIDDVLDVSRIEAGEMEMHLGPVPLQPLIESALSVSASLARRQRVRLAPAPALPAGLAVQADATRLRQVVLNLLSNGCKYNRPGGQVAVEVSADPGAEGTLFLDVVDDGVGMSPAQLDRLFEPFNRLGREQGPVEGTGIGLHLSRQLVLKMGGRIEVNSTPGRGTRMRVALARASNHLPPAPRAAAAAPAAAARDTPLQGRVLYIEDNPVNLMLVEQFLLRWPQVHLSGAGTADGGLARLRAERFDLVLLDMQLPDMHGTELLHQLRREGLLDTAPVVALSASAMPEAVDAALSAGAAEYWTKPLDLARMGTDLRRFLRAVA